MKYIAALDYEHLDNGMFLTAVARSVAQQSNVQPVFVHGDSDYTNRIMQAGVMREDAKVRSIKGLNHRLINLLADEGVSAIGINGYQRKLITLKEEQLTFDSSFFNQLPRGPALLISTLIWNEESASPEPISLPRMVTFLKKRLNANHIYTFTKADKDEVIINNQPDEMSWDELSDEFIKNNLPEEFEEFGHPLRLSTARDFGSLPNDDRSILIH